MNILKTLCQNNNKAMPVVYEGKEPCQGCKRPGNVAWRTTKNRLCQDCEALIKQARAQQKATETHVNIFQHYHAFRSAEVNRFVHEILAALHNENAVTIHAEPLKWTAGNNGKRYKIPERTYEGLKGYFNGLDVWLREIETREKDIPEKARAAALAEKTQIYNEGIEYGRNLLLQLGTGGVTMEDFEKQVPYQKY
jgi:hypothetical protein